VTAGYLNGAARVLSYRDIEQVEVDTAQGFIQALYHDFRGQAASAGEVAGWEATLASSGRGAVASGILRSPGARAYLVDHWFLNYLGRAPAPGEDAGWVNLLLQGQTEEQVLTTFFVTYFGNLGPDAFVTTAYQLLMGRPPTDSERMSAVNGLLPSVGYGGLITTLVQGSQFRTVQVTNAYLLYLHRLPTTAELNAAVNSGWDLTTFKVHLVSDTTEYYNNAS
jgi:hypothetical protein